MYSIERVTTQDWSVFKILGEAALYTLGKIYDYSFTSKFLQDQYELFLGTKANFNVRALFVLRADKEIVGVIAGYLIGNVVTEVVWYVKPKYRNGTHGVRLLKELEKWGKDKKAKYISISRFKTDKNHKVYKPYKELILKELR